MIVAFEYVHVQVSPLLLCLEILITHYF